MGMDFLPQRFAHGHSLIQDEGLHAWYMPVIGLGSGSTAPSKTNLAVCLVELRVGPSHEPWHGTYGMIHDVYHESKAWGLKRIHLGGPA